MDYSDSRVLDLTAGDLVQGDWKRSLNRARINALFNGEAPFNESEAEESDILVNVNDMTAPSLAHQARAQYASILSQGQFFTARTDHPKAPKHKRDIYSAIFEAEANQPLKQSVSHFEALRSGFASLVLHGIGPSVWENPDKVIQRPIGIEDALLPTRTLVGFENLPFIYFRRSFTAMELQRATRGPNIDPGWNMPFVKRCLSWVDREMTTGLDSAFKELYVPEKVTEDQKEDSGWYMADSVPTVDCFDIYAYVEATRKQPEGWVRRIILDSWSSPTPESFSLGVSSVERRDDRKGLDKPGKDHFLYSSGSRVVADKWEHFASFQYADLSAVSPFRYHNVRSLGWLSYAACHLLLRMKCRFYESVFEQLLQYFRINSSDEAERAMKVELAQRGFIDETIKFIPAAERWQPNVNMAELGMQSLQAQIEANSKSWTQNPDMNNAKTEKTKFQVMAEVQSTNALVAAGLQQSYQYKVYEYRENVRRLLRPNSKDPIARQFRTNCLRRGIPEEILVPEAWDIQAEKLMGQGNQTLELLTSEMLMQWRPMLDPEPQRVVLRKAIFAATKDPGLALELVPETPAKVTPATHAAENDASTMLNGIPVEPETGINHMEYVGQMLKILGMLIAQGNKSPQKTVDPKTLQGLKLIANCIAQHIKLLAQDKTEQQFVKQAGDALGKLTNEIKAFEQRLVAAMKARQKQAQAGNGGGGEAAAKILPALVTAKAKAKIKEQEAAQKAKHKDIAFAQEIKHKAIRTRADVAAQDMRTAADINRGGMKSFAEGGE